MASTLSLFSIEQILILGVPNAMRIFAVALLSLALVSSWTVIRPLAESWSARRRSALSTRLDSLKSGKERIESELSQIAEELEVKQADLLARAQTLGDVHVGSPEAQPLVDEVNDFEKQTLLKMHTVRAGSTELKRESKLLTRHVRRYRLRFLVPLAFTASVAVIAFVFFPWYYAVALCSLIFLSPPTWIPRLASTSLFVVILINLLVITPALDYPLPLDQVRSAKTGNSLGNLVTIRDGEWYVRQTDGNLRQIANADASELRVVRVPPERAPSIWKLASGK